MFIIETTNINNSNIMISADGFDAVNAFDENIQSTPLFKFLEKQENAGMINFATSTNIQDKDDIVTVRLRSMLISKEELPNIVSGNLRDGFLIMNTLDSKYMFVNADVITKYYEEEERNATLGVSCELCRSPQEVYPITLDSYPDEFVIPPHVLTEYYELSHVRDRGNGCTETVYCLR